MQSTLLSLKPALAVGDESIPSAPLFCASINTVGTKIESQLDNITKQPVVKVYNPDSLSARQSKIQKELMQKRAQWDNERNQQYDKMLSLAQNDAQKTAITAFKSSVEDAILTRRNSVDSAITTYFNKTGEQLSIESDLLTSARQDFLSAVSAAITTAKSDCQNDKSPAEIRAAFQTNIATARQQLQASRQSIGDVKNNLEAIRKEEIQSINKAVTIFQTSLSSARQTLIDKLKKSGASTSQFGI